MASELGSIIKDIKAGVTKAYKPLEDFQAQFGTDLKTFTDKDLVMWHGTSEARWEIIQNKGLRPGYTGEAYVDLVPGYSEHNVYLAHTPKGAQFYAKRQAKKDNSKGIVLRVQVPDPSKIVADDRYARGWEGKIIGFDPKQIKSSVKELGEVGYNGRIPPKFIRKK